MLHTDPCVAGAVNKPEELMLPQEVVQIAGMFAVNCCVSPAPVVALGGEIARGEVTVTAAVAT